MTLVIGGCSFTYNEEMTWVGKVAEQYNVVNVGSCAAGNDYIARSVLHELQNHMRPTLICQWSGIHRKSYLINEESIFYNHFKRHEWPDWAGDYHNVNHDAVKQDQFWIKTGGNNIKHSGSSELIHKNFVEPYLKHYYNDEQALVETFENILRVQYYCQLNDIDSYMFWWKDELVNYKLGKYSTKLYNEIQKMNTTWLPNLGDWCVFNTDLKQEDLDKGYHPTKVQHNAFGEEILRHIK